MTPVNKATKQIPCIVWINLCPSISYKAKVPHNDLSCGCADSDEGDQDSNSGSGGLISGGSS